MSDVLARVTKITVQHLQVAEEQATPAATFVDDLGADSLDLVELVMAFEEEFSLEVPDDAAEKIVSIGSAVAYIEAELGAA